MFRPRRAGAVLFCSVLALTVSAPGAWATITPQSGAAGALAIANAMTGTPGLVTGASFVSLPPSGTPNGTSDSALGPHFPTEGATFGILTSGNVALADDGNIATGSGTGDGGGAVRGDTDRDVTVMQVEVSVPTGHNCLALNFAFYSEEYPEYVNTQYNDGFIAEMDSSTWTTSGTTISAPKNFAFDPAGAVVSINSTGGTSMSPAGSAGTTYDGGTTLLSASTPVTPGAHSLFLSIFDQGDMVYDSAVFLDSLETGLAGAGGCEPGAQPSTFSVELTPATGSSPVGSPYTLTATVEDGGSPAGSGVPVLFSTAGANSQTGSGSTDGAGQATFAYAGPAPGNDTVTACVDANANGACDPSEATDTAAVTWEGASTGPTCNGLAATIVGTGATINGTSGNDVIVGTSGRETILASGGNDTICAGAANDAVYGGAGHDVVFGEGGNDMLKGEAGNDSASGQDGMDMVMGDGGNDTVSGGDLSDKVGGGAGDDNIAGDGGNDQCYGQGGVDSFDPSCEAIS